MTTIGPAAAFADRLRTHLARASQGAARPPAEARGTGHAGHSGPAGPAPQPPEATLAARVAALDPADPRRRERAFMLFLESLLQAEFGEALHADPGLPELAERVAAQLRADARLATLVEEVTDRLLAGPG
jgi:hypothetical protein